MSNSLLVAVEICKLCGSSGKQFTCESCVKAGNFSSSISANEKISYATKKKRLKIVVAVKLDCMHRLEKLLNQKIAKSKNEEVACLSTSIETLKSAVQDSVSDLEKDKVQLNHLRDQILEKRQLVNRLACRIEDFKHNVRFKRDKEKHKRYKTMLVEKRDDLKKLRVDHVQWLVRDIFPLSQQEIYPQFGTPPQSTFSTQAACMEVISQNCTSTESELEEATRTVLIDGKWICQDCVQTEQMIVGVGMPPSNDFMKYYEWLKSFRNQPRNSESQPALHDYTILSIPASLTYATQLTEGLAFYLGVVLPHAIDYNQFSLHQPSRSRLFQTISKLSVNIMHLCFTQMVPLGQLQPEQLLRNINVCISAKDLGRFDSYDITDYSPMDCPFLSDSSSAEELNYDSDDDDSFVKSDDWDQLTDLPPDHGDMCSSAQTIEPSSNSSASGLVTSAAASVASALWSWKR